MGKVIPTEKPLEWWETTRPIPYARNARVIPDTAVGKVAASIKEFGFRAPIIVDGEGVIIAGHTRLLAAQRLGLERVPVIVADDLTPAQVKAYRLADNRTAQESSSWDFDLLGIELEELAGLDVDLSLTGFEGDDIERWLVDVATPPALDGDDALLHQWTLYFTDNQLAVMECVVEAVRSSGYVDGAQGANAKAAAVAYACEVYLMAFADWLPRNGESRAIAEAGASMYKGKRPKQATTGDQSACGGAAPTRTLQDHVS